MAVYSLSRKAAKDIADVYEYTILNSGLDQAREYLSAMQERFQYVADHPMYGRPANELASDIRRIEYRSHVVFYLPDERGVRIIRVLHARMHASRHF